MSIQDNEKYNKLVRGAEELLLKKKFDEAYKNYKTALDIRPDDDNIKKKITKLDKYFDLRNKVTQKKAEYDYNKAMQLALKLVLNGTYGAFANKYFVLSNSKIANAITVMGRNVIQYMLEKIEDYFYNNWHKDEKIHQLLGLEYLVRNKNDNNYYFLNRNYEAIDRPFSQLNTGDINNDILKSRNIPLSRLKKIDEYEKNDWVILYEYHIWDFDSVKALDENPDWEMIDEKRRSNPDEVFRSYKGDNPILIYGDTDSCDKNTIIRTNKGEITIENFYNENIKNGSAGNTLKGHESVNTDDKILNYDDKKGLYYAPVKRIIRHKVSKPKWRLKTKSGKEILVTNDHSMIVFRNGKKLEIKPSNILKTDKILVIKK
jgi:hypothetical protein